MRQIRNLYLYGEAAGRPDRCTFGKSLCQNFALRDCLNADPNTVRIEVSAIGVAEVALAQLIRQMKRA